MSEELRPCPESSPRMRGAQSNKNADQIHRRIIPAYAGSTWGHEHRPGQLVDHPRVCGEHTLTP